MRHPLLAPDLRELILERDEPSLREFFSDHHPADDAEFLDDLAPEEACYVMGLLDGRTRSQIFAYLDPPLQEGVASLMELGEFAQLLTFMSHDERADLITRLPQERVDRILPLLAHAEREDIRKLSSYREGTAGAVMTSDYATLPAEAAASEAIGRLRREAPDKETIYYCYVLDEDRKLVGFVSLKDLILAPASRQVSKIMQKGVVSARVDDDQEEAAQKLMEYDLIALPILDADDHLVGIITHDDVADLLVDEATEDVHRMGAVGPLEEAYLLTPFATLWGKRCFWLAILFVGGFLTTTALAKFEYVFEKFPVLVLFLPLIISAGGNCGSQSATLITRSLALGEIRPSDWARVLWHEILMGASLGLTLGLVGFARSWFVPAERLDAIDPVRLGMVVAAGVAAVVLCGNLVGALMPLVLKKLGLDPALTSNPFVASIMDVTGILAYFVIAVTLLGG